MPSADSQCPKCGRLQPPPPRMPTYAELNVQLARLAERVAELEGALIQEQWANNELTELLSHIPQGVVQEALRDAEGLAPQEAPQPS